MKKTGFALLAAVALSSTQAIAVPFTEIGDAASLSPQYAGTDITSITGSTGSGDLQDLFSFTWGGGQFEAATNGLFGSSRNFDTMLFLFDNAGTFITSNNDAALGDLGSHISANLGAGDYQLGITGYGFATDDTGAVLRYDAQDASGNGFEFGSGSGALANWGWGGTPSPATNPATGNYTIGINASTNSVPEPAPLALLALGLTAFGLARRKAR